MSGTNTGSKAARRLGRLASGLVTGGLAVLFAAGYVAAWGWERFTDLPADAVAGLLRLVGAPPDAGTLVVPAAVLGLVVLHEAVHAAGYVAFGDISWDGVGMSVALLSPIYDPVRIYVYPVEPIAPRAYLLGVAMPGVLTGVVPAAVGVVTGSPLLTTVGIMGTLLAYIDVGVIVASLQQSRPARRANSPC